MNTLSGFFAIIADTALKATVLLTLAWGAGRLLKNRSSASRHLMRTCALSAALLLAPLSSLLPAWKVQGIPQLRQDTPPVSTEKIQAPVASSNRAATKIEFSAPTKPRHGVHKKPPATAVDAVVPVQPPASATIENEPAIASSSKPRWTWPQFLSAIWLLGAIVIGARMLIARMRLARLIRQAAPVGDQMWTLETRKIARLLGIRRRVTLLESTETEVPLTTGILRPKVILSPDHPEWSPMRRAAVLHHELAHIKRLDSFTQIIADWAVVFYWFHPLVWITVLAMRAERERACDDHVLAAGTRPSEYAHELLEIASSLKRPAFGAALAMARRSQLEGRLMAVLNPKLQRGSVSRKVAFTIAVLTLCVVFPLAAMRAAQQKPSPGTPAAASTPGAAPHAGVSASTPIQAAPATATSENDESDMEAPEPPEPPEAAEAPEPPSADSSELADLRARLADLLAQEAALKAQAKIATEVEMQARMADLRAQTASMRAQIQALAAAPLAGIRGGVQGGISGGVPAVPPVPAVPGVPAVPAVPAVPPAPASDLDICGTRVKMHNMSINNDNGNERWTANWSGDDCSVDLRASGKIQFNAEATDIQSISDGGFFEVNQRQGNTWKQIRVTPSASGLQYVYKVNGTQQAFDTQAKQWFSSFLLALERTTGFAADSRVRMLLQKGGPNAVLDEIANLRGDYVRGIYFRKLLEQPNLPAPVVVRVINQAGQEIGSDYEKARVLMAVAKQYQLPDETSRTAFLNAAGKLKSDYEHSRVLIELLKRPNISSQDVALALHSAEGIQSDYEKSRILLSLLDQKSFDQTYLDFYLKMVSSIQSDYEKSRDLLAPMRKYALDQKQINQIMDATSTIGSDYEKSRLLNGLVDKGKFDEKQMGQYLKVVESMGSDYERGRSLLALMEHNTLSKESVGRVLDAIGRMGSDYEKARTLIAVAQKYPLEGAQREKYLSIANSLGEYEKNRSLAALVKRASI